MRLYTMTHFMLSPMAKGIQATHSTVNLFKKYTPNPSNNDEVAVIESMDPCDMLWDWSINHETMISLNGGVTPDMNEMVEFLEYNTCPYPWAYFREDESLGELVTSISIVLPERLYNVAYLIKTKVIAFEVNRLKVLNWDSYNATFSLYKFQELEEEIRGYGSFSDFDKWLIDRMNGYRLASV